MSTRMLVGAAIAAVLAGTGAVPAVASQGADNGRITFGRFDPTVDAHTLWIADADGGNQQQLVEGPSWFSDWSPDGTRIAHEFVDDSGVHIGTISPDGSDPVALTSEPGVQESPDWSRDRQWIAFDAQDTGLPCFSTSIWVMRADGTDARRITSGGFDVEPVFSPDGSEIAFVHIVDDGDDERPQVTSLLVVRTDGSGLREVVPARAGMEHPDWSPNGKWLGFDINPSYQVPDAGSLLAVRPDGKALHVVAGADTRSSLLQDRVVAGRTPPPHGLLRRARRSRPTLHQHGRGRCGSPHRPA